MKKVLVALMSAVMVTGCAQQERMYSADEVEAIKESVRAEYATEPETETETEAEVTSDDPWENGTLESIGLGDMPKPNDNYQVSCKPLEEERLNKVTGEAYTYQYWEIKFSESMYENYADELTDYIINKCPYSVGWYAVPDTQTPRIAKSDRERIRRHEYYDEYFSIYTYSDKVYFLYFTGSKIMIWTGDMGMSQTQIGEKFGSDLDQAIISYINQQ